MGGILDEANDLQGALARRASLRTCTARPLRTVLADMRLHAPMLGPETAAVMDTPSVARLELRGSVSIPHVVLCEFQASKRPRCHHPGRSERHRPLRSHWAGTEVTAVDLFPTVITSAVWPPTPSLALHVPGREWRSKLWCTAPAKLLPAPGNVVRASASAIKSGPMCHRPEHRAAQDMP